MIYLRLRYRSLNINFIGLIFSAFKSSLLVFSIYWPHHHLQSTVRVYTCMCMYVLWLKQLVILIFKYSVMTTNQTFFLIICMHQA